jgi:glycosyltransferase involved in cell wall biosynthesis
MAAVFVAESITEKAKRSGTIVKIAIIHDWLTTYAGAERVLEQLVGLYPQADLFALVDFLPPHQRAFLADKPVRTSFVQCLPFARTHYRQYLPFMPLAVEQFDLSGYDLVISSSHAVAKGVLTGPDQLHLCLCYTPMRYAWDLQHQYLKESGLDCGLKGWLAKWILHRLRLWDLRTANGVDEFVAISRYIARRIWKTYRRESTVIYPPVDVERFVPDGPKEAFYLTASRMVPYKKIDLIVESFSQMPDKQLIVIGDGPDFAKIRVKAGTNVTLLGHCKHEELKSYLQRAKAFVFAAEEDFGIAPLEAQACGTAVIAYGKGGAPETIRGLDQPEPTGVFFVTQSTDAIIQAINLFEREAGRISPEACRQNALRFSPEKFRQNFSRFAAQTWTEFNARH